MKTKNWFNLLATLFFVLLLGGSMWTLHPSLAQGPGPQSAGAIRAPMGSAFTYQGRLTDGGSPASGAYDFEFKLYDALSGGSQVGSTVTVDDQAVSNGLFTVPLNFGAAAFGGNARYLDIAVRAGSSTGAYTVLTPRQEVTAAPYALYALDVAAHDHWGETWSGSGTGLSVSGGSTGLSGSGSLVGIAGSTVDGYGGVYGSSSGSAAGVYGSSTSGHGVHGSSTNGHGVYGSSSSTDGSRAAVYGSGTLNSMGIYGTSANGVGVFGVGNSASLPAIYGVNNGGGIGIYGFSNNNWGIYGVSTNNSAVYGNSTYGHGVYGQSSGSSGIGVYGYNSSSGDGIRGYSSSGYAGYFAGDVSVNGTLSKSAGSFMIDHPLDPQNQYLYHSFVESPDMMNIYNGNVTLDENGEAWVEMPDWFEALNGGPEYRADYRYQLTPIGGPGPNLYIAAEIANNRFKIAGGTPGLRVSWQVTGIRHDPYAEANRIPVEEAKPDAERGTYLHPEAYGQPATMGLDYQRTPGGDE